MTTSTMNGTSHGKVRKSLETQLNRFDTMLDGLSEAIPQVVAETMQTVLAQAVREAVQAAVAEVMSSPAVLERLSATTSTANVQAPAQKPSLHAVLRERLCQLWSGVRSALGSLRALCGTAARCVCSSLGSVWHKLLARLATLAAPLGFVAHFKTQIAAALVIGAGVALAAWLGGPAIATALSGIGGFGSSIAVQGGLWIRKMLYANEEYLA